MAILWPGSLPTEALFVGWREKFKSTAIESPVDWGPPKSRRRFTAGFEVVGTRWAMTSAQLDTLRTFHETTTLGGTQVWQITHPETDATVNCRFVAGSEPEWSKIAPDLYRVTFPVRILA